MGKNKILSYPLIANFGYQERYRQFKLQAETMKGLRASSQKEIDNGPREAFIDFRGEKPEAVIKVRNLLKVKPSLKKRVKNIDEEHLNVMHIFLDTVGRSNFHRKYANTLKFLKKYHYLNKKKTRVYEFFRLHSIRGYTFPNLFGSLYGAAYDRWRDKHITSLYSYHKQKGYITAVSSDTCINSIAQVKSKNFSKN